MTWGPGCIWTIWSETHLRYFLIRNRRDEICTFGAHALQMDRPKPKFKANTRLKYGAKERKCSLVSKTSQSIYNNCSFKASSRLFGGHFSVSLSFWYRSESLCIPKTDINQCIKAHFMESIAASDLNAACVCAHLLHWDAQVKKKQ